jgi:hypothetical protein
MSLCSGGPGVRTKIRSRRQPRRADHIGLPSGEGVAQRVDDGIAPANSVAAYRGLGSDANAPADIAHPDPSGSYRQRVVSYRQRADLQSILSDPLIRIPTAGLAPLNKQNT